MLGRILSRAISPYRWAWMPDGRVRYVSVGRPFLHETYTSGLILYALVYNYDMWRRRCPFTCTINPCPSVYCWLRMSIKGSWKTRVISKTSLQQLIVILCFMFFVASNFRSDLTITSFKQMTLPQTSSISFLPLVLLLEHPSPYSHWPTKSGKRSDP